MRTAVPVQVAVRARGVGTLVGMVACVAGLGGVLGGAGCGGRGPGRAASQSPRLHSDVLEVPGAGRYRLTLDRARLLDSANVEGVATVRLASPEGLGRATFLLVEGAWPSTGLGLELDLGSVAELRIDNGRVTVRCDMHACATTFADGGDAPAAGGAKAPFRPSITSTAEGVHVALPPALCTAGVTKILVAWADEYRP